jgi:hypothetical protein
MTPVLIRAEAVKVGDLMEDHGYTEPCEKCGKPQEYGGTCKGHMATADLEDNNHEKLLRL